MDKNSEKDELKIYNQIIDICNQIASSSKIIAISTIHNSSFNKKNSKKAIEVILILKDFQPRIISNSRILKGRNISIFAVDQWIFERDVDRCFLGEAFASNLVIPYRAILGKNFCTTKK